MPTLTFGQSVCAQGFGATISRAAVLLVCQLVWGAGPLPAQDMLSVKRISTQEGLSHPSVTAFLKDRHGFLWIGTRGGLNRYDGYGVRTYHHRVGDSTSLGDGYVRALTTDDQGRLWVATFGGGISILDEATGTFRHIRHDAANPASLSHDMVTTFLWDPDGTLWVGTFGGGLNRMDPTTGEFTRFRYVVDDSTSLSHDIVKDIHRDRRGQLWIGTDGGGLNLFQPSSATFRRFHHDPADPTTLTRDNVWAIEEDQSGTLWIATYGGGLDRFDPNTETFTHFRHDPNDPQSLSHNDVTSVLLDTEGRLWAGTWNGGLNELDPATGRFTHHRAAPSRLRSLSNDRVWTTYQDDQDALWVGTTDGVNRFEITGALFQNMGHSGEDPRTLSNNQIIVLLEDRNGEVWVATDGGGVNRFLGPREGFRHYRADPDRTDRLSGEAIYTMTEGPEGKIWVGVYGFGIERLDPNSGAVTERYAPDPADPGSLIDARIRAVYFDRARTLWVGTDGEGLDRLDAGASTFIHYRHEPDDPRSLSSNRIGSVLEDRRGALWVGTLGAGLNRLDRETGQALRFQHDSGDSTSLSHNNVVSLFEDNGGTLWVSTFGGGLNRLDRVDAAGRGVFRRFTMEDGLPSDVVSGIVGADDGMLWITTPEGIVRYDPGSETFEVFGEAAGVFNMSYNVAPILKRGNGEIWFGGDIGITVYAETNSVFAASAVPRTPLVFTAFKKFNEEDVLSLSLHESTHIRLDHDDVVVSFEFAALNFFDTRRNEYEYRLEGFSDDWITLGTKREVTFTDLDPGTYTLRVRGGDQRARASWSEASLQLAVTPAFWQTVWFRGSTGLGVGVLLLAAHFARTRTAQRRVGELQQEMDRRVRAEEEKTGLEEQLRQSQKLEAVGRLTGGIAHDFNNLLTVVLGNLELLDEGLSADGEPHAFVDQAMEAAMRGAALTQRLLAFSRKQALRPHPVDLRQLVAGMDDLLRRTLGETITVVTVPVEDLWHCEVDPAQLENVLLNLAINARDAMSLGGTLTIETANTHLYEEDVGTAEGVTPGDYVLLAVSDTGTGMPPEVLRQVFDPFFTTKGVGRGTGLGLSMVYGFVKQSGGHVKIYSEVNEGTTVKLYLPRAGPPSGAGGRKVEPMSSNDEEPEPRGNGELILVVEDDSHLRALTVDLLGRLGYRTVQAGDARDALAILEKASDVSLLFTDVVLPGGMSGADLGRVIQKTRPELQILYTSGYTQNAIVHHGRLDPGVELLDKPFTKAVLARAIHAMLAPPARTSPSTGHGSDLRTD